MDKAISIDYTKFSPICCVIGHVDVGKTKLLDYLRHSNTKEVSGITQQLGATYYNRDAIENITGPLSDKLSIPGLIVIDTPGHECFTTMRVIGSKLSHVAILLIDVTKGIEKETIESINILKSFGTEFVIALNKIDRIYGWKPIPNANLKKTFASQSKNVLSILDTDVKKIICQLAELEINALLYYDKYMDIKVFRCIVPISASTGEGVSDLIMLISKLVDRKKKSLERLKLYKHHHGYILDKREDSKFGTFYLAINNLGILREGSTVKIMHGDSVVCNKIKAIIMAGDNVEMKDKHSYKRRSEVDGSHGLGIIFEDDIDIYPGDIYVDVESELTSEDLITTNCVERNDDADADTNGHEYDTYTNLDKYLVKDGVCVIAPSISILSAVFKSFSDDGIGIRSYGVGKIDKNIIIHTASILTDRRNKVKSLCADILSVILIFDPIYSHGDEDNLIDYINKDIINFATEQRVKLIASNTVYKLKDKYLRYKDSIVTKISKKYGKHRPFTIKILPQYIFMKNTPLLFGVRVESGLLTKGSKIKAIYGDNLVELGTVTDIQKDKTSKDFATEGDEVCIKIGNDKKIHYGKDFDANYVLTESFSSEEYDIWNTIKNVI